MRSQIAFPFVAGLIVIIGCARTTMTSVPSPALGGRTFQTVLVFGNIGDLALRTDLETRMAANASDGDHVFIPSHKLFFPGRQYSNEEVRTILASNHVDATLVVSPGETGASSGYIPPTYTSSCTAWNSNSGCTQVTTSQAGGFSYSKPWAQFSAQLYDVRTGESVWVATATTGGNAYASASTLVRSMADKTAHQLANDGLLR